MFDDDDDGRLCDERGCVVVERGNDDDDEDDEDDAGDDDDDTGCDDGADVARPRGWTTRRGKKGAACRGARDVEKTGRRVGTRG